jgi:hypothetical protein
MSNNRNLQFFSGEFKESKEILTSDSTFQYIGSTSDYYFFKDFKKDHFFIYNKNDFFMVSFGP